MANMASEGIKASAGRQKIEMKKVEQKNKRHVTFSKRKLGLFHKATELSILCQAQTAIILFSQNNKAYAYGHPTQDAVITRYLSGGSLAVALGQQVHARIRDETILMHMEGSVENLRQQYEAAQDQLEEERKLLLTIKEAGCFRGLWWNQPIEEMCFEHLEQFKVYLGHLTQNVVAAAEKMRFNSMPPPKFSYLSLLNGDDVIE